MKIKTLYKNNWVSLKKIINEPNSIYSYIYSHETRCNGHIISILPYRFNNKKIELLFRYELIPCWNITEKDKSKLCMSSITGGWEKEKHKTIKDTVIEEMKEETGYIIQKNKLIDLGYCFGTKSCDTIYHLFSIEITNETPFNNLNLGDRSELEKKAYCEWKYHKEILNGVDPFLYVSYVRLIDYLKENRK